MCTGRQTTVCDSHSSLPIVYSYRLIDPSIIQNKLINIAIYRYSVKELLNYFFTLLLRAPSSKLVFKLAAATINLLPSLTGCVTSNALDLIVQFIFDKKYLFVE